MLPEKQFENKIKEFFHQHGIYPAGRQANRIGWYVKVWGGGFQKAGVPDILACIRGRFVAIEVKASNGRPSALQILNCENIQASGGLSWILYPEEFEEFKHAILSLIN